MRPYAMAVAVGFVVLLGLAVLGIGSAAYLYLHPPAPPRTIMDDIDESYLSPDTKARRREMARHWMFMHEAAKTQLEHDAAREIIRMALMTEDAGRHAQEALEKHLEKEHRRIQLEKQAVKRQAKLDKLLGKDLYNAAGTHGPDSTHAQSSGAKTHPSHPHSTPLQAPLAPPRPPPQALLHTQA